MRKEHQYLIILFACLLGVTGCSNQIPEMTPEQEELVVEYASSELLQFDANHPSKLQKMEETEAVEEQEALPSPELEKPEVPEAPTENTEPLEPAPAEPEAVPVAFSIEECMGLQDISITYKDYEVEDFYPTNGNEIYFVMNATEGNKLLVLKFDAENSSGQDYELKMNPGDIRFKVVVNGETKNALTTMLLNDMSTFQGTIPAAGSEELVIVAEFPAEKLNQIDTLDLMIKKGDESNTISIK